MLTFGETMLETLRKHFPNSTITHVETLPGAQANYSEWPDWVDPNLKQMLIDASITAPYTHQRECAELAWSRQHIVVATGTSSGKSLGYQLPILTTLARDSTACALYLTPTKALGSDQLHATQHIVRAVDTLSGVNPAPYDGDTPPEARANIREHTRFVFTNPDMLHAGILAAHPRWVRVLRHLQYVVIDECHSYRGVFGANVALVLRRLLRIAAAYGAHPTFIFASATAADPAGQAARLCGKPVVAVTEDGAPAGERTIALWEPGFIKNTEDDRGVPVRYPATTEAAGIMATLIAEGATTLTFVRSRRAAETVAMRTQEELSMLGRPDFARRVASYRAGYLAEDRRALERALDNGELLGLASTNALELGIDVGGLDAVVMAGFPGTVASFRQQLGRAGRRGQHAVAVLVARDDPMDTYFVHHPEALLGKPIENSVFNPSNPYILRGHIYCAAVERPLAAGDLVLFGPPQEVERVITELEEAQLLRRRGETWYAVPQLSGDLSPETAHATVQLRGGSGSDIAIVDVSDGRLLGSIDTARAMSQVHDGAIYLHQGEHYVVDELDLDDYVVLVRPATADYSTQARSTTEISILNHPDTPEALINPAPGLWVANVDVEVIDRVTGYVIRLADGTVSTHIPLDLPEQRLITRAVAYTIDPVALDAMGISAGQLPGALHAAEHAAIGLLPLLATCDRWDIGGVSTALHQDTMLPTVFVYDGHPGGAGFADEGFARFHEWMTTTFEAVSACGCTDGCPSCVYSPKCGTGNQPLDKHAALRLLGALVAMTAS